MQAPIADAPPRPAVDVTIRPMLAPAPEAVVEREPVLRLDTVSCWYGTFRAVKDVSIYIKAREVTALFGPSGCGKTTLLRTMNRMNDLIPGYRTDGHVQFEGEDLYGTGVDPVAVRRRIGMVFQKPNPFPKSVYDNVAFGPRINGFKGNMDALVEHSLRRAALWNDVKDKLKQSGMALSGGQQQRLCIARAIAVEPEIILMDEPCAALDPIATAKVEELIQDLRTRYTIVIVTHNMQQAARASDQTAFFYLGRLVEFGATRDLFMNPANRQTEDYVSGRFG